MAFLVKIFIITILSMMIDGYPMQPLCAGFKMMEKNGYFMAGENPCGHNQCIQPTTCNPGYNTACPFRETCPPNYTFYNGLCSPESIVKCPCGTQMLNGQCVSNSEQSSNTYRIDSHQQCGCCRTDTCEKSNIVVKADENDMQINSELIINITNVVQDSNNVEIIDALKDVYSQGVRYPLPYFIPQPYPFPHPFQSMNTGPYPPCQYGSYGCSPQRGCGSSC